jgi:hypothetical protein
MNISNLVGGKIVHADMVGGGEGELVPVLIVKTRTGQEVQVEAWRDPEGNGPGHLSIGPVMGR